MYNTIVHDHLCDTRLPTFENLSFFAYYLQTRLHLHNYMNSGNQVWSPCNQYVICQSSHSWDLVGTWAITRGSAWWSTSKNFQKEGNWNCNWKNWLRLDSVRFVQPPLTACDSDWFWLLLIAIQADCVSAFNFISFPVIQLIALPSLIANDRHCSSDCVGVIEP